MQPSQRSRRPPRLSRRNAIRQSAYVARPASQLSPPSESDQPAFWYSTEESVLEERVVEDEVGDHAEAGGAEAAALVVEEASTSSSSAVSVHAAMVIRRSILNWSKLDLIGAGSSGRVYKAVAEDGFVFAVKEASLIGPESYTKQTACQLKQEILLLSRLEHKNIVQYFGAKKGETVLCIFLEFVSEGSLVSVYEKQQLEESTISSYTRQILNGLAYLHHHNVMHRDIKCANILVDKNGAVKVGDFGLAKEIKVWKQKRSCTGSVYWMAPEFNRSILNSSSEAIMSSRNRKYDSGAEKRKKRKRLEAVAQSQKGALDKFFLRETPNANIEDDISDDMAEVDANIAESDDAVEENVDGDIGHDLADEGRDLASEGPHLAFYPEAPNFWRRPWMGATLLDILVVRGNPYGYSADIWSLGCTVLEMLTQRIPYPDDNWVNPDDRPSADELLNHPFVAVPEPD
ncbi:hypothetical protein OsI_09091 [Oryza sativa Indica Group]|uniref:mitogen-activated protein kinase kinase kinase n=1 Tax=Oryza sativa subsp. indica TaxID=39946 RepID=B8AJ55_ORYSI|nr:hypothetical protein OsI_09091 [Oryza sativa Indica Group]